MIDLIACVLVLAWFGWVAYLIFTVNRAEDPRTKPTEKSTMPPGGESRREYRARMNGGWLKD